MSRTIDTIVKQSIESDQVRAVFLVKMKLKDGTYIRLNDSGVSVYWDEDGSGEKEYKGAGRLLGISKASEGIELQEYSTEFTFSGIPLEYVDVSMNLKYKNQPIIMYLAVLDTDNTVLFDANEKDGPLVVFSGKVELMSLSVEKDFTIKATASSRLADWERKRGGKSNHHSQSAYYSSLHRDIPFHFENEDKGFEYVESLKDKEIVWGGKASRGAASGGGGGGNNNSNYDTRPK